MLTALGLSHVNDCVRWYLSGFPCPTLLAGITVTRGKRHGLHSLRHSLASTLLEQGASLAVISEILGHVDSKSTSVYLHTDLNGLKACALDPEEVFQNA